ncbi:MAG: ABC transporter transmembrane domain-containing protein [Pseudomonadota bacterium]
MAELPPIGGSGRTALIHRLIGLGLAQAGAAGAAAAATRAVFDALGRGDLPPTTAELLAWWAPVTLVLAALITLGAGIAARATGTAIGYSYAADLRLALYRVTAREPLGAVARRRPGAAALRFVGDLGAIRGWIGTGIARGITALIVLPAGLVFLWIIDPLFIWAGLGMIAGTAVAGLVLVRPMRGLNRDLRRARARLAADLAERLRVAPALDLAGRRQTDLALIAKRSASVSTLSVRRARRLAALSGWPQAMAGLAGVGCLAIAHSRGLSTGDLAAALAIVGITLQPLRDLATLSGQRAAYVVAATACRRALARPPRKLDATVPHSLPRGPKRAPISWATGQDWTTPPKRAAVLAGPGRALLTSVLAGDAPAPAGWVRLSGRDLAELAQGARRRRVTQLSLAAPILKGSLRRALSLGAGRQPDDTALLSAVEAFGLGAAATDGLETRLGEGGVPLSRRDRARVLLARAALAQTPLVLITDTPELRNRAGEDALRMLVEASRGVVLFDAPPWEGVPLLSLPRPASPDSAAA